MSTIKPIEKSQTKTNKDILSKENLTKLNQEYRNNTRVENSFGMEIIVFIYLIFRILRKFKINFDINLNISGKNKKP
ncbi:MAG: hypothetical protein E2590_09290 [Chryseobacterium sp.]|nr:hypothetical protein [Chryseobacterium sp.]